MSYCAETDIEARCNLTISSSSVPTTTQVSAWIGQVDAELESALVSGGYAVPVTNTTDLKLLCRIATEGVGAMVEMSRYSEVESSDSPHGEIMEKTYRDYLRGLRDGSIILPYTARGTSDTARVPRSFNSSNSDEDGVDAVFTRDMDF